MTPAAPAREPSPARAAAVVALGLVAAGVLAAGFEAASGSREFVGWTLGAVACWLAGGWLSRPLAIGRRRVGEPVVVAVAAFAAFAVTAVVVRSVPVLDASVGSALDRADGGALAVVLPVALASGLAEEVYFRGALWRLVPHRPLLWTTAAYVALTVVAARNLAIGVAALVMGAVFGWQRSRGGGLLAPAATHLTWSLLVVLLLPR